MINHLIDILKATEAVTDITTTSRIFPLIRLQGSEVPALVLQLTGATPNDAKDLPSDLDENSVQVTGFATDPATAWALMEAVRDALDGYSGGVIAGIRFQTHASDVFETTEVFSITARYDVLTSRSSSNAPIAVAGLGYDLQIRGALITRVETLTATDGQTFQIDPDDHMILIDWPVGAANGTATIYLPPIASAEGRILRIKAGGNVDNQHRLQVRPYPGDTATIDGETFQETGVAYCATAYLATGGAWYILNFINKF